MASKKYIRVIVNDNFQVGFNYGGNYSNTYNDLIDYVNEFINKYIEEAYQYQDQGKEFTFSYLHFPDKLRKEICNNIMETKKFNIKIQLVAKTRRLKIKKVIDEFDLDFSKIHSNTWIDCNDIIHNIAYIFQGSVKSMRQFIHFTTSVFNNTRLDKNYLKGVYDDEYTEC